MFVNGSRAYVPELLRLWPQACVVHVTAPAQVLHSRLLARQREDAQAVQRRLERQIALDGVRGVVEIVNDGALDRAVAQLHEALRARLAAVQTGEG